MLNIITAFPSFTATYFETVTKTLIHAKLYCHQQQYNEISLSQLFNHSKNKESLRFNPSSKLNGKTFDLDDVYIQLKDVKFNDICFTVHFQTLLKENKQFEIGDLCSFASNQPGFEHLFILKARIGDKNFVLLIGNECKRVGKELLVATVEKKLNIFNGNGEKTTKIEWNKLIIEGNKLPGVFVLFPFLLK
jgi:hypothetical protein